MPAEHARRCDARAATRRRHDDDGEAPSACGVPRGGADAARADPYAGEVRAHGVSRGDFAGVRGEEGSTAVRAREEAKCAAENDGDPREVNNSNRRRTMSFSVERRAPGLWMAARRGRRPHHEPRPSPPQDGAPSPPGRSAASPSVNCGFVLAAPCSAPSAAHHVTNRAELMFCLEPMPIEPTCCFRPISTRHRSGQGPQSSRIRTVPRQFFSGSMLLYISCCHGTPIFQAPVTTASITAVQDYHCRWGRPSLTLRGEKSFMC